MALRGTVLPQAVSSAQAAQVKCDAPQIPQARGVTTNPACGSLSLRITSKPRNISACVHAFVTTPFSISTRTSRSPSTRPTGEMSSVSTVADIFISPKSQLNYENIFFGPRWCCTFGSRCELDVTLLVDTFWHVLRDTHNGLCLKHSSWREIEERELRLCTA